MSAGYGVADRGEWEGRSERASLWYERLKALEERAKSEQIGIW